MACDVPCTAGEVAGGCATGALGRGDDGKQPEGGARVGRYWPDQSGAGWGCAPDCAKGILGGNQLTSVPADIGQLTELEVLWLERSQLTSVSAAIRELIAAGYHVYLDDGVTVDE